VIHDERFPVTSESVSEGHPDKVADQISDAVLDAILTHDPRARVAAETLVTTGLVVLAGEITTTAVVDYPMVARETIKRIGYDNTEFGIDTGGARSGLLRPTESGHRTGCHEAVGWTWTRAPATRG